MQNTPNRGRRVAAQLLRAVAGDGEHGHARGFFATHSFRPQNEHGKIGLLPSRIAARLPHPVHL